MPSDLFQRAHKFYSKGNLKKAEDCCKLAIANDAGDYEAYNLLGVMAINAKRFGDANGYLERAVGINGEYAAGYSNLGVLYSRNSLNKQAKDYFKKALSLQESYSEASYNLGWELHQEKQYEQAIYYYKLALAYNPDLSIAYNNIGDILSIHGYLNNAIQCFESAIKITPNMASPYVNLIYAILAAKGVEACESFIEMHMQSIQTLGIKEAEIINNLAILKWILGKVSDCQILVNRASVLFKNHSHSITDEKNYRQIQAYNKFLKNLINWYLVNGKNLELRDNYSSALYFIGESHSITCANKNIEIGSKNFKGETSFIMGCKIWHLINEQPNKYKVAFYRELSNVPKNSYLVLTIGEIDCRPDGGIFKRYLDKQLNWRSDVNHLVSSYFEQIIGPIKEKNIVPLVWNIPAPHKNVVSRLAKHDQDEYLSFIKYINDQMSAGCKANNIKFIDNYAVTADADGVAIEGSKLDEIHLKPDIFIKAIQNAFSSGNVL